MFRFNPTDMQYMAIQVFSAYASFSTCIMMFRAILRDLVPEPLRSQLQSLVMSLLNDYAPEAIRTHLQTMLNSVDQFTPDSSTTTIIIEEQCGDSRNEVYDAAQVYLRTKISPSTGRIKVGKTATEKKLNINFDSFQEIMDTFNDVQLTWKFGSGQPKDAFHIPQLSLGQNHLGSSSFPSNFLGSATTDLPSSNLGSANDDESKEKHYFELSFDNNIKEKVLEDYLPQVVATAKKIKDAEKVVKLYTADRVPHNDDNSGGGFGESVNLNHPASFETLVMDIKMKSAIIEDLERFVTRRDYYKKVGKAWKRGYLMYGPSGADKSSLVAAMANYLKFDIYDLHLSSVQSSSDLRRLLVSTTNCSIIVIEDVDRSAKTQDQSGSDTQPMLSSILNFLDGLWSDERIVIFTTNSKDKLDPSFLCPGRMDMHIHMSYCTYHGFRLLVSNYFEINDHHRLFDEIQILLADVQITHEEIAEELMKSENVDSALTGVVNYLKRKKTEGLDKTESLI